MFQTCTGGLCRRRGSTPRVNAEGQRRGSTPRGDAEGRRRGRMPTCRMNGRERVGYRKCARRCSDKGEIGPAIIRYDSMIFARTFRVPKHGAKNRRETELGGIMMREKHERHDEQRRGRRRGPRRCVQVSPCNGWKYVVLSLPSVSGLAHAQEAIHRPPHSPLPTPHSTPHPLRPSFHHLFALRLYGSTTLPDRRPESLCMPTPDGPEFEYRPGPGLDR